MTEEPRKIYPYISRNQWWKLRAIFKKAPQTNVSQEFLMTNLGIKQSAAGDIYRNLVMFKFIDERGKTTPRANEWRVDDLYSKVCKEIREEIYPKELLNSPEENLDQKTLTEWFMRNANVGDNFADKNARAFKLLMEANLTDAKKKTLSTAVKPVSTARTQKQSQTTKLSDEKFAGQSRLKEGAISFQKPEIPDTPPNPSIHIDIQIHIDSKASADQIDYIFASIAKHLYRPRQLGDGTTG